MKKDFPQDIIDELVEMLEHRRLIRGDYFYLIKDSTRNDKKRTLILFSPLSMADLTAFSRTIKF